MYLLISRKRPSANGNEHKDDQVKYGVLVVLARAALRSCVVVAGSEVCMQEVRMLHETGIHTTEYLFI